MKTVYKKATATKAYGNELPNPIEFQYSYEELQKGDEIPAKEMPDADDILGLVNAKRNASARAKAQTEAFNAAGIEKPSTDTPEFRFSVLVKTLVANGTPQDVAETTAKTLIYG